MLYEGDCMEAMKEMPDNAYELAVVDPPYAVGADDGNFGRGGGKAIKHTGLAATYRTDLHRYAQAKKVPGPEYFAELFRVSKNQIIWGANYYPQYLYHSGWIIWDKQKTDGLLSEAELAFQSYNKTVRFFRHVWEGFRKGKGSFEATAKKTIHPNQKPVALYKWLLKNYAKPGDKILDTHLGSGSSAIAAYEMGFDFTGYEIDHDYFMAAKDRIERHMAQGRLFEPY
jgi:site-specific DNA-methyltransferase (adenine-specific)